MSLGDGGEDEAEEADDFRAGRWRYTTSDILVKPGRPPPSRAVEVGADAGAVAAMVSMTRGLQQLRNGLGFGKTLDAEKYTQRRGFVEAGLWRVGFQDATNPTAWPWCVVSSFALLEPTLDGQ